jgi:hypothetical protein
MKPVAQLLKDDFKKIKKVEGLDLISDDEMHHLEMKDCLGPEFTKDEDKLKLIRNQEQKLSLNTINSIKNKTCRLSKEQLVQNFDLMEVSSTSSADISIADSSSCSIY